MARGWESKSVEQQQAEMADQHKTDRPPVSLEQRERDRKRQGLILNRKWLVQQLERASHLRHRQMLEQAIADLDQQLSLF